MAVDESKEDEVEKMRRDATTLAIHARGSREEQQTRTGAPTYLPP